MSRRSPKMIACQQKNGRRSRASSTMASAGVHFSIVHWVAGSVIPVGMCIPVLSAGVLTPGTGITELLIRLLLLLGIGSSQGSIQIHKAVARMMLRPYQSGKCQRLMHLPGRHGIRFQRMLIWWQQKVHGSWRSSQAQPSSQRPSKRRGSGVCPLSTSQCVCRCRPPFDVVDVDLWQFIMQLILLGAIWFAHFGTPCNTYSAARKEGDGGPPPLRSAEFPDGLPGLADDHQHQVFLGNLFRDRTCEACFALALMGFHFSVENPLGSLIWATPKVKELLLWSRGLFVDLDQCFFGAPSKKPTRLLVSHQIFQSLLAKACPGNHKHVVLKGKVFSHQFGRVVYRTKLAQVYPAAMCSAMASAIRSLWDDPLQWFPSFFRIGGLGARSQTSCWTSHCVEGSQATAVSSGCSCLRVPAQTWCLETPP